MIPSQDPDPKSPDDSHPNRSGTTQTPNPDPQTPNPNPQTPKRRPAPYLQRARRAAAACFSSPPSASGLTMSRRVMRLLDFALLPFTCVAVQRLGFRVSPRPCSPSHVSVRRIEFGARSRLGLRVWGLGFGVRSRLEETPGAGGWGFVAGDGLARMRGGWTGKRSKRERRGGYCWIEGSERCVTGGGRL
jgi:hypothetical protein